MTKDSSDGQSHYTASLRPDRLSVLKVLALVTLLLPLLLPSAVRGDFASSPKNSQAQPQQTKGNDTPAKSSKPSPGSQKKGGKSSTQPNKSKKSGASKKPQKTA